MPLMNETRSARPRGRVPKTSLLGGVDGPPNSPNSAPAQAKIARLRRQRHVEHCHRLGPAPLFHLLTELDEGKPVWPTVARCAGLPADLIRAYGGDQFAPATHVIEGRRR
jgi:hypothetical protein